MYVKEIFNEKWSQVKTNRAGLYLIADTDQ